jgi:hypothetical protein
MRARGWGADLGSTCSISAATHCIYKIPHVMSAVGVGGEGEMLTVSLGAVEQEWGDGRWIWAPPARSHLQPAVSVQFHLY